MNTIASAAVSVVKPAAGYALAGAAVSFVLPGVSWQTGAKVGAVAGGVIGLLGFVGRRAGRAKRAGATAPTPLQQTTGDTPLASIPTGGSTGMPSYAQMMGQ